MPRRLPFLFVIAALLSVPAPAREADRAARAQRWATENSDIAPDSAFRLGRLANGMRYIVRRNATPAGTAMVRLDMNVGSLDEKRSERGYAHFVEHMAFNGSRRLPEGEMVRLLERNGLAFGADTNASTGFDRTLYKLDLPTNDPALLETALMLMRETASELTIAQGAVERERGVILAEMRDRNSWQLRDSQANTDFFYPGSLFARRFPIGTTRTLDAADARKLRAFYAREYVPQAATLVVVGDFDPALVEARIRAHFDDWKGKPAQAQPDAGKVRSGDAGRTTIYIDPAVSERVTISRNGTWLDEPDSIAQRRENLLRQIGYDIVNRRLLRLSRQADPPFRGAGFGTGDVFETARSTRLIVDTVDRKWRRGLIAAGREYRRALAYGFAPGEVSEQLANLRTALEDAAAAADTRSNSALTAAALALVDDRLVPSTPGDALARFRALEPAITPDAVLAAMRREVVPLDNPLIRFRGRFDPVGGTGAIRAAWREALKEEVAQESPADLAGFAYTDFGHPGVVISDTREAALGIREIRFANGVMLNLKRTELEKDRVFASLSVDGGDKLDTRDNPLATEMMPFLDEGGLGKHSTDELQTILAGHTVGDEIATGDASFDAKAATTPRDLELQLQLWAALLTDPGYRAEGEVQYRHNVNNYFAQLRATPAGALRADQGAIVSAGDPRFSLQDVEKYRALTFAKLKRDVSDRLAHGAIEIGLAGDIDEDRAIALVAATFGALPAREAAFRDYADQPPRPFTQDRTARTILHSGPADQALVRVLWPTRDDADPAETMALELLERVARLELTDLLRETLGKAYSPGAVSAPSHAWKGYGTFSVTASVDVQDVPAARDAIRKVFEGLRAAPVDADVLLRARQPLVESLQNALKTNGGWLALVDRAQSEPAQIERFVRAKDRVLALGPRDVQAIAQRYLDPAKALELLVLPQPSGAGQRVSSVGTSSSK